MNDIVKRRIIRHTRENYGPLARNDKYRFASLHALSAFRSSAIYTYIPKNACSTMRLSLALDNGLIRDASEVLWIHKNNDTFIASLKDLVTAKYTFVILRDPFTRLASCFLDKVVDMTPDIWGLWDALGRPWEIGDLTFRRFVAAISDHIRSNHHWTPQSDFLMYEAYDDYFPFEDMVLVADTLRSKIDFEMVDGRPLTRHGSESYGKIESRVLLADAPIRELGTLKAAGRLPHPGRMYDRSLVKAVKKLYREDIEIYEEKTGRRCMF